MSKHTEQGDPSGPRITRRGLLVRGGVALVIVAYHPQIRHLFVERCAWGISVLTWVIWLAASALLLTYCVVRRELLMCVVQGVNIAAIVNTIVLVRRSNQICPSHRRIAETKARQ